MPPRQWSLASGWLGWVTAQHRGRGGRATASPTKRQKGQHEKKQEEPKEETQVETQEESKEEIQDETQEEKQDETQEEKQEETAHETQRLKSCLTPENKKRPKKPKQVIFEFIDDTETLPRENRKDKRR
jgi:hypothetical protein